MRLAGNGYDPGFRPASKALSTRRSANRSGAAAVEFALLAPFLITLLLGMIEFGRVMMVEQVIINGAREGCRSAVLPGGTVSNSRSIVQTYLTNSGVPVNDPTNQITITPDPTTAASGSSITVNVTVPFSDVSWLPTPLFMGNKTLGAKVVMRLESNQT